MYRLEEWATVIYPDPWQPPEMQSIAIRGKIYNHPNYEDGHEIITSSIASANGKIITTKSGSIYQLGKINKEFVKWMEDNKISFDPENPVTMK
jgi:hypothetical protein